jgi:hypothetical protein
MQCHELGLLLLLVVVVCIMWAWLMPAAVC